MQQKGYEIKKAPQLEPFEVARPRVELGTLGL